MGVRTRLLKKVEAGFNEVMARAANRPCEESMKDGCSRDLLDLVASFMEREVEVEVQQLLPPDIDPLLEESDDSTTYCFDIFDRLRNLLGFFPSDDHDDDIEKGRQKIRSVVKDSLTIIGGGDDGSETKLGFKLQLVAFLRDRGLDAGICKSKWDKSSKYPAGEYQYIDVKLGEGRRFIVEVSLAGNFQIARPSRHYSALVELFPKVFVGTTEELKQVVRLMCNAMKESMMTTHLLLPPWRRNGYMQAKWFASYKRSTTTTTLSIQSAPKQSRLPSEIFYQCRHDFTTKNKGRPLRPVAASIFQEREWMGRSPPCGS